MIWSFHSGDCRHFAFHVLEDIWCRPCRAFNAEPRAGDMEHVCFRRISRSWKA